MGFCILFSFNVGTLKKKQQKYKKAYIYALKNIFTDKGPCGGGWLALPFH